MIESPLQILREKIAKNIKNISHTIKSPIKWVTFFVGKFKR